MKICDEHQCMGCCACLNICPKGAITMVENSYGAIIPQIDSNECIECGLCQKVCPVIVETLKNPEGQCYAAWSNDRGICKTSASAGIVATLSEWVIENGGVVFGTRYEAGRLVFDHTEAKDGLIAFRGSKYTHAYVGETYRRVKRYLKEGRRVLFVGTPCQIAGLKNYIGKDDNNLLMVDLLCHGIVPAPYLQEYVENMLGYDRYDNVLFRSEHGEAMVIYSEGDVVYKRDKQANLYYMAYVKGLLHRENCYHCPFTSTHRCGDITAGDFWGLDRNKLIADSSDVSHVSLVLINTPKGAKFMNGLAGVVTMEERPISEALVGNGQLSYPCLRHPDRDLFLKNYKNGSFCTALRKTPFYGQMRCHLIVYGIRLMLCKVKHFISKLKET